MVIADAPGDVYFHGHVQSDAVRRALAKALGLPLAKVAIRRPETSWPIGPDAIATPWIEDLPGDWPCDYWLDLPSGSLGRMAEIIASLALDLGVAVMTDADTDDPFLLMLATPDGSVHEVPFMQDDDGGFRDTPEIARLIADRAPSSLRLAS